MAVYYSLLVAVLLAKEGRLLSTSENKSTKSMTPPPRLCPDRLELQRRLPHLVARGGFPCAWNLVA